MENDRQEGDRSSELPPPPPDVPASREPWAPAPGAGQPAPPKPSTGPPGSPAPTPPPGVLPGRPLPGGVGAAQGQQQSGTNGMAIAALVCGLVPFCWGLTSILAVIFGFVARDQIKKAEGRQTGDGMAVAGIVLGILGIAFWITIIILAASGGFDSTNNGGSDDLYFQ